jgi:hypothetical protein
MLYSDRRLSHEWSNAKAVNTLGENPHVLVPCSNFGYQGRSVTRMPGITSNERSLLAIGKNILSENYSSSIHLYMWDTLKFVTTIRAPYFDKTSQSWEEGFFCRACVRQGFTNHLTQANMGPYRFPAWDWPWKRYTRDGMEAHLV